MRVRVAAARPRPSGPRARAVTTLRRVASQQPMAPAPPQWAVRQCLAPSGRRAPMPLLRPGRPRASMPRLLHRGGAHRRSWAPPHPAGGLGRGMAGTSILPLAQPKGGFADDVLPRCVIGRSGMAAYAREMHSQAPGGGDMLTLCVPGCLTMAIFCPGVSQKGLGREKGPFVAIYRRRVFKMSWLW